MAPIRDKRYIDNNNNPDPAFLQQCGPVLDVLVHVPNSLATHLSNQGLVVPPPQSGKALIDTGASGTCVHEAVLTALGLNPIGVVTSGTAAGQTSHNLYPVRLEFPADGIDREFSAAAGVDLTGQVADVNPVPLPIIVLIGRDVLQSWILIYNGPLAVVSIAY